MLSKFMKLGMQAPYVIPDPLTKWYVPFMLILVVMSYLSSSIFEF
jgi:hypothetical protein